MQNWPDGQRSNSKSNFILGWLPYQIRRTFKISSAKSCQGWCWEWWDERREKFGKQKASFQFYLIRPMVHTSSFKKI